MPEEVAVTGAWIRLLSVWFALFGAAAAHSTDPPFFRIEIERGDRTVVLETDAPAEGKTPLRMTVSGRAVPRTALAAKDLRHALERIEKLTRQGRGSEADCDRQAIRVGWRAATGEARQWRGCATEAKNRELLSFVDALSSF